MNESTDRLASLASLARESSPEGRQKLLHEVTDMFMEQPESLNDVEIAYFGEIMGRIVGEVETMVRQHLSETIAAVPNAPKDLVVGLANDQIEVALPVLVKSTILADDDLVNIVKEHSQEHLKAISMRAEVSETVTDVLVEKGSDMVLETLATNMGAKFSRDGMETMVVRAQENETLNQKLVTRADVPEDLTQEMFWRVSWAMREQILGADDNLDTDQVDALMAETESWFKAQLEERQLDPAEKFITRKEKLSQLDNGLLLSLMRQGKTPEFIAGLGRLAKVDAATARQTVFDPVGEKLVVVCKALEMDDDVFWEIVDLANFDDARSHDENAELFSAFQRITAQSAQRALRFLRTRKSVQQRTEGDAA